MVRTSLFYVSPENLDNHGNLHLPSSWPWFHHWGRKDYVSLQAGQTNARNLTAETIITGPSDLIHIYHLNTHYIPLLIFIDNFSHLLVLVLPSELITPQKTRHTRLFWGNFSVFKHTTLISLLLGKKKKKKVSLAVFPSKLY